MHPIAIRIIALQRRLAWRDRALAACWTLAAVLATACLLGFTDYWVRISDRGLRLMITAALIAVAVWAVIRWWLRPGRRTLSSLAVARRVEEAFPELHDRLASALEFLPQSEDDPTAGSATLRRAVVLDAELAVGELPLESIIDRRPLRRAAVWAAAAAAVVVICLIADAAAVRTALVRLVAPLGATQWPRANLLKFRDPPTRLAAGQTFEAELVDCGGRLPDDVQIQYRIRHDGRSEIQSEWMSRVGDVMVARRADVRRSFAFRAEGGDDRTMRWIEVEVVEPPRLSSLTISTHPPAYTGLPPAAAEGHLDVLAGTRIEVSGAADEPLGAARVIVAGTTIEALIRADAAGQDRRSFYVAPDHLVAGDTGSYRVELENLDGVAGTVGEWNLRVEPDTPPNVAWQRPRDDVFVLPTAVVPLAVTVKDDLAVASVELRYTRSDQPEAETAAIELFRGPPRMSPEEAVDRSDRGDIRVIEHTWPLTPMNLSVGTQLTLHVRAEDYRPASGETATPRRVTIIDRDELDARLADRQSQLARRLDEVLALQRTVRGDVRGLEIQLHEAGRLSAGDRDSLQTGELNQRRVGRMLVDPADGVAPLADAMFDELAINGIANSELVEQLENLKRALTELAAGPLAAAERELTSARKTAESASEPEPASLAGSLATAGVEQDRVIDSLERLLNDLTGWADYGRLVRDVAKLREDQLAHVEAVRTEVGLETLPLEWRELSRQQRATLSKAAAAQETLARRFERIERRLDSLATVLDQQDAEVAGRIADAVELARRLAISGNMHQAHRDLGRNRVGQALAREAEAAAALQELLDTLRDRRESRGDRLVEGLRAAERKLAALRQELAELRQEIAAIDQRPEASRPPEQLQQLHERQQHLRSQIDRLARQLDRLQAADAGRSAGQAARKLEDQSSDTDTAAPRPSDRSQFERAEQDLAEAARQLAERRREAEEDLARMFLAKFQAELAQMVADQREVVQATADLDARRETTERLSDAESQAAAQLADTEREIADNAHVHSEFLSGLGVIEMALSKAKTQLEMAASLLDAQVTGQPTQLAEQRALAHLEQIVSALEQTAAAAGEQPPEGGAGGPGGDGQQPRPLVELFEVKLLRMLQADLHTRTQALDQRLSEGHAFTEVERAALARESEELAAEQGHLAELVEQLLARNNREEDQERDDE